MHRSTLPTTFAAGLALALVAGAGEASTCYVVLDAKEAIVYRGPTTPVDLSERGAAARDALRRRGELLMIIDAEQCAPVSPSSAPGRAASVDEIVAGLRPAFAPSGGVYAPMPTDVGPTPAAQSAAAARAGRY